MSDILMKGTEPIGQVADITADNVEYSSGVSVKDKIDSFGVVVGQLASTANSWTENLDLPNGFNDSNTVCIGVNISTSGTWKGGDGITGANARCVVELLSNSKFRVYNTNSDVVNAYFRATFYKFA